jgi:asparagine synthase (glutamine-hydrolysing)
MRDGEFKDYPFKTKSDCEVIMPLYEKYGVDCVKHLDGMYAFLLSDEKSGEYYAARDHMGIIPLYIGYGRDGSTWFASEMKALIDECERFELFPPGHYYTSKNPGVFTRWWDPIYRNLDDLPTNKVDLAVLRTKFEKAVKDRMMSDVPWGVLLSGGLDSRYSPPPSLTSHCIPYTNWRNYSQSRLVHRYSVRQYCTWLPLRTFLLYWTRWFS